MLEIIRNNPYRFLGVCANAPMKDRVANQSKMNAFLKVGKQVTFPLDLNMYLPPIQRTSESVQESVSALTLQNDQMRYAQFWFVKADSFDDIAINHLTQNGYDGALNIWLKKTSASTLQNRVVCYLFKEDYKNAILSAEQLYASYTKQFIRLVLGDAATVREKDLITNFLDVLSKEISAIKLLPLISNPEWQAYVKSKSIDPIITSLQEKIDVSKATRNKTPLQRYNAGKKLMTDTKPLLKELKSLLPSNDIKLQMICDKLANEILQCGIDYFNGTESGDRKVPENAMKLQKYALSIAMGKMTKDRCQENVNILQKIIDELPPEGVGEEIAAITVEITKFKKLSESISNAVTLLKNTKPHLQTMRNIVGSTDSLYLKISTAVVNFALENIISEVNSVQKKAETERLFGNFNMSSIREVIRQAWDATLIMDTFDMESEFKRERYSPNRATLKQIYDNLGLAPRPISKPNRPSYSSTSSNGSSDGCFGMLLAFLIPAIIFLVLTIKKDDNTNYSSNNNIENTAGYTSSRNTNSDYYAGYENLDEEDEENEEDDYDYDEENEDYENVDYNEY